MAELLKEMVDDELIPALSYKLEKGTASYITRRRSATFFATGSNVYTSSGTRVIRFNLTGSEWVDPSTIRVMFNVVNKDATAAHYLRMFSPHGFFSRIRISSRGQLLEDISEANRISEMLKILNPRWYNKNDEIEGVTTGCGPFTIEHARRVAAGTLDDLNSFLAGGLEGGKTTTLLFRPCFGLFNQKRYLPLRWLPLQIDLELVNDATAPLYSDDGNFINTARSIEWQIEDAQIKCDVIELDGGMTEQFTDHLQKNGFFQMSYTTYTSQVQSISGKNVSVNITRAVSFLKRCYISFIKSSLDDYNDTRFYCKEWNNFYSPLTDGNYGYNTVGIYDKDKDIQSLQVQIGSETHPEYPIRSSKEAYYHLTKTLPFDDRINSHNLEHHTHSLDIAPRQYFSNKFIVGIDTEKVHDAAYTAKDLRAGDLLTVKCTFPTVSTDVVTAGTTGRDPDYMHIVLVHENVITIRDLGVSVLE